MIEGMRMQRIERQSGEFGLTFALPWLNIPRGS